MKIREDFVTNSSSSSFIIAIKDLESELKKVEQTAFAEMVKKVFSVFLNDDGKITTVEKLAEEIIDRYGCRDETLEELFEYDSWAKTIYEKGKEAIENGFVIYNISVDYGEEALSVALSNLPESGDSIYKIYGEN